MCNVNWRVVLKNTGVNAESLQFRRWRPQRCTETCQAGRERWGRRECRARAQWELGDPRHGDDGSTRRAVHANEQCTPIFMYSNTSACMYKILRACGAPVLETEGLRASQPVSKKLGQNPVLSVFLTYSKAAVSEGSAPYCRNPRLMSGGLDLAVVGLSRSFQFR